MAEFKIQTKNRKFLPFPDGEGRKWEGPFTFLQAADPQLGMMELLLGHSGSQNTWDVEIALARRTVQIANSMKPRPRFFVICGDLVDALPDDPNQPLQMADFLAVYAELSANIPLVCVCGNHDVGDVPTRSSVASYRRALGDDYFSFWTGGVQFIVLNSQLFEDDTHVKDLSAAQEEWLDAELEDGRHARHLVVFQHFPIFIHTLEEPKGYYNLELSMRRHLLAKFKAAGVRTLFYGHLHENAGGFHDGLEQVVTSAVGAPLGDAPHGMRLVRVMDDVITHKYYGLDDWPTEVASDVTS